MRTVHRLARTIDLSREIQTAMRSPRIRIKSRARERHHRKTFNKNRSEFSRSMSHRERTAMRDTLTACNANAGARTQESLAIEYAPPAPVLRHGFARTAYKNQLRIKHLKYRFKLLKDFGSDRG